MTHDHGMTLEQRRRFYQSEIERRTPAQDPYERFMREIYENLLRDVLWRQSLTRLSARTQALR
ncbi:MAG: hypothetical protein B0D96_09115 [Candidatus Sedimenticola endophacoides]|uniref:Uncharacterized protein n=1 Tax=Candidatus Sedimenticola endophacoides TaxID=2548426 RepID=A0A657PK00_9GAMM|nr:MAG: hypothetical protein B0D94_03050 [Candidatus Sedimenticola endophacoides]OQX34115.1 MAG: hypothetical protein B0D84_03830 [Candidatus Sedimenticola endophacoides]OQX34547.1 MAG: hypothetical protein B0D96_09115 [Candidatus Sedimenticola endophacoides]OQX41657.1 MAG: hypothetical protein B0D89_03385 [Candidatus Sedimenticola endophacoides]OQX43288.1 MAG: hypothetical protein B0D88_04780 [Candidatus Sedimenticola endophacoides]